MNEKLSFQLELEQQSDYEFRVKFDWPGVDELLLDEPEPLGHAAGPNAARLIGAAVANCLWPACCSACASSGRRPAGCAPT